MWSQISFLVNETREVGQPVAANDVGKNLEGDEVKFHLLSRVEEHKEQQDDYDEGACESFIILDNLQKFKLEQVGPSFSRMEHAMKSKRWIGISLQSSMSKKNSKCSS